ncbi:hypothetical protein H0G86_012231 [Trichoderma simmonsii]|uniref:Uncharacterized protein n=1 Tax=Trichoderma simmonsii TaxID=1491479 RepID=A0A8G0LT37_9HYPO|nr:hypothetical protein H0G86_012231 [Trichoderma simmonsii]
MVGAHRDRRGWVGPAGPVLRAMPLYVTRLVTVVAPLLGGGGGGHGRGGGGGGGDGGDGGGGGSSGRGSCLLLLLLALQLGNTTPEFGVFTPDAGILL